jgi:hypothetical protein
LLWRTFCGRRCSRLHRPMAAVVSAAVAVALSVAYATVAVAAAVASMLLWPPLYEHHCGLLRTSLQLLRQPMLWLLLRPSLWLLTAVTTPLLVATAITASLCLRKTRHPITTATPVTRQPANLSCSPAAGHRFE